MTEPKPLNWTPTPGVGYSVIRRGDGGMTLTFTDLSDATLEHWHQFALEHLLGADRRTRNLYDLRAVKDIPAKGHPHGGGRQQRPVGAQHPRGGGGGRPEGRGCDPQRGGACPA